MFLLSLSSIILHVNVVNNYNCVFIYFSSLCLIFMVLLSPFCSVPRSVLVISTRVSIFFPICCSLLLCFCSKSSPISCFTTILDCCSIGVCASTQNAQGNFIFSSTIRWASLLVSLAHALCHQLAQMSHDSHPTFLLLDITLGGSSWLHPKHLLFSFSDSTSYVKLRVFTWVLLVFRSSSPSFVSATACSITLFDRVLELFLFGGIRSVYNSLIH